MTATQKPMLAQAYEYQDPTGWMMSEKLDGVRAIWDGERMLSRNGNEFFPPAWFTAQLPSGVMLDGELFIGRGKFQTTVGAVRRRTPDDAEWAEIRYCVFDAPQAKGVFTERLAFCESILAGSTVAAVVPHIACEGYAHMDSHFQALLELGAEGIMLRAPRSRYENRRSANLLKYKPFHTDEATLTGHEPGEGRLAGITGALVLEWEGITFRVGSGLSDEIRTNPPAIGAKITFGYCGVTDGGCPRFPTFIADRSYE